MIPNYKTADFMINNVPRFECPDKDLEEIYYFRWWTFRKHIKQTPDGYVISEFLPSVPWAGKYNGINCAAMHTTMKGAGCTMPLIISTAMPSTGYVVAEVSEHALFW
jgi:hypothetical protein